MSWKKVTDYWAEWKIEEDRRGNIGISFVDDQRVFYDLSHENFITILNLLQGDKPVWFDDVDESFKASGQEPK
ncbi:MAG: hypothetical protein PHO60_10370 [Methanothrix sp.]|jgi:hypothetical protein|uniref:Uncharacterized protein n=1 Tax=Methanothrix harundinacea TaxID=301375 RepID=A0A101IFG9_9EURY|nr:MAG: hypothetical protein XD72_1954 [Methanothrix harundinacea]MDD2639352.1 hypothetical protein [Methanothrix sp.]MDI9398403.1 hypothetical protein [Euryarchaeota archaeon]KUK94018.1 MAG: hypothetical protein XE07_2253 [Methanothrix harundinacea]MCP1393035.1 hypothetical protein [Methanothrix harundinacea]